jgi:hypothetical protein
MHSWQLQVVLEVLTLKQVDRRACLAKRIIHTPNGVWQMPSIGSSTLRTPTGSEMVPAIWHLIITILGTKAKVCLRSLGYPVSPGLMLVIHNVLYRNDP